VTCGELSPVKTGIVSPYWISNKWLTPKPLRFQGKEQCCDGMTGSKDG
jgi:hypothetical protein